MKLPQEETESKENPHGAVRALRALMGLSCPDGPHLGLPTTLPLPLRDGLTTPLTLALSHRCASSVCQQCPLGPHCCPVAWLGDCRGTAPWWSPCPVAPSSLPWCSSLHHSLPQTGCHGANPHSSPSHTGQPHSSFKPWGLAFPSLPEPASQLRVNCQTLQESMAREG